MLKGFYSGKKVFITGHTGFKGSWLCRWLLAEGTCVTGYALPPDTEPSLFRLLDLKTQIKHIEADIRDAARLSGELSEARPDIVFHLAAQPLVRRAYQEPRLTWETNVMGTANMLDALRTCETVRSAVIVTSDKCYENREWLWGYRENDALGGHDPYSASKAAAELAVSCWRRSFPSSTKIASARAGNVIGGGDWNCDRLVPDFIKAIQTGNALMLRNPASIRPWQHVLEPLYGYMLLAERLFGEDGAFFEEAWNFGPPDTAAVTVKELAEKMMSIWGGGKVEIDPASSSQPHESGFLKLDCSKAASRLGWRGLWGIDETLRHTVNWYKSQVGGADSASLCDSDIRAYQNGIEINEQ